jgi:hypothetical protein
MSDVQTICATVLICWLSGIALAVWVVCVTKGKVRLGIGKEIELEVGDHEQKI